MLSSLRKQFSSRSSSSSTAMPEQVNGQVVVQDPALVISRRVSVRGDCSDVELEAIKQICSHLGSKTIDPKIKPLKLLWEIAANDEPKYQNDFLLFLKDTNEKLLRILINRTDLENLKAFFSSNLNAMPSSLNTFYLLIFKSELLLGKSDDEFSIDDLIDCATKNELISLTHPLTLDLITKGELTPKAALGLLNAPLDGNPLRQVKIERYTPSFEAQTGNYAKEL